MHSLILCSDVVFCTMCKQNCGFDIANVKNILLGMEIVVIFWLMWYNFQRNVFVVGIVDLIRTRHKDDFTSKMFTGGNVT